MLLIYTPQITERKKYIFKFIFEELFNIGYKITDIEETFKLHAGPAISYAQEKKGNSFFIFEAKLLNETLINANEKPNCQHWNELPILYPNNQKADLPFDIFAASFFLLSRYEEYTSASRDEHGRFGPEASLAFREKFLEKPIVNIWANAFALELCKHFPQLEIKKRAFKYICSFDIDSFYAYKGKSILKTLLGTFKSIIHLKMNEVIDRKNVLAGKKNDPFDTFDLQADWEKKYRNEFVYFFHLGDPGKNDRNVPSDENREMQNKIRQLSETHKTGLHPSYRSNEDFKQLEKEFQRFENISGKKADISRQHFLKMNLPKTYRDLIKFGVAEDYTMGYAQAGGFRAGVAWPFMFYDLKAEQETTLKIFPFAIMDGTLKDYLQLKPEEAEKYIFKLMEEVRKSGGIFISILHNHTVNNKYEWKGWKNVFEKMLQFAFNNQKQTE